VLSRSTTSLHPIGGCFAAFDRTISTAAGPRLEQGASGPSTGSSKGLVGESGVGPMHSFGKRAVSAGGTVGFGRDSGGVAQVVGGHWPLRRILSIAPL